MLHYAIVCFFTDGQFHLFRFLSNGIFRSQSTGRLEKNQCSRNTVPKGTGESIPACENFNSLAIAFLPAKILLYCYLRI